MRNENTDRATEAHDLDEIARDLENKAARLRELASQLRGEVSTLVDLRLKASNNSLTPHDALALFAVDPATGNITHKVLRAGVQYVGQPAAVVQRQGRLCVVVFGHAVRVDQLREAAGWKRTESLL